MGKKRPEHFVDFIFARSLSLGVGWKKRSAEKCMPFGSCPMMIGDFDRTRTEEATGCMQFLADTLGFSDSTEQELTPNTY